MESHSKHYAHHELALCAVNRDAVAKGWGYPEDVDFPGFLTFLGWQRMQGIWTQTLDDGLLPENYAVLNPELTQRSKLSAAIELPLQRCMEEVHAILQQAAIPYFFFKGAQLRHTIYQQPWHRPTADVDVFVKEEYLPAVLALFQARGFKSTELPETISHEIKLTKYRSDVDLHWNLVRPSRYRPGLNTWLFQHRQKFGEYWGLDATASLLVMLVHPAITKYLVSPTSMLIHQVDQLRLIHGGEVDWEMLTQALDEYGLKTAAWSSVHFLSQLTGTGQVPRLEQRIRPGPLKRYYLRQWIDRAWITRFFDRRWLVAAGFSLALQDSLVDTVRSAMLTFGSKAKVRNAPTATP